jgi:hypothetical protein
MRIDKNFVKGKTLGKYYLSFRLAREGYRPYFCYGPPFALVSKIKKPNNRRGGAAPNS